MRFSVVSLAAILTVAPTQGFAPASVSGSAVSWQRRAERGRSATTPLFIATSTAPFRSETIVNDTIFSGEPTDAAYQMNHREIILQQSVQAPGTGDSVPFSQLLSANGSDIVVFLRSLG